MKPANKSLQVEKKANKPPISYSLFDEDSAITFLDTVSTSSSRTIERIQTPRSGSNVGIAIRAPISAPSDGPRKITNSGMAIRRTPTEDY